MSQATRSLAGRYELGPMIGEGGMGRVHRGFDRTLGRPVAVKILAAPHDRAFVERFRREARSAARLANPNVVAVYDTGSDGGTHFIVTELVEGETLADRIRREGRMPQDRAVEIATEIARALAGAHEIGLVHRDVKPGNVMLAATGEVKVVDFGIARAAGGESLTRTGLVMGSVPYLSPEQAEGPAGDERSDLYALGCVLFEMLTGYPPFVGPPMTVLYRHAHASPPVPSDLAPVSPALERIVLRLLEKDPAARFGSASELADALETLSTGDDTMPIAMAPSPSGVPTLPLEPVAIPTEPIAIPTERFVLPPSVPAGARSGQPGRWLAAAVLVAVLVVLAAAFGATGGSGVDRASARSARATPEDAYGNLVEAISGARVAGDVSDREAEALEASAAQVLDSARAGDDAAFARSVDAFRSQLMGAIQAGEISFGAAETISTLFTRLLSVLETSPPPSSSPSPDAPTSGDAPAGATGSGGSGIDGNQGHGPPEHANGNAYGNDD